MLRILEEIGFKYEEDLLHNQYIRVNDHYYYPDFTIPKLNLIIECDGEHWHKDIKKDKLRDTELKSIGYNVIRFSGKTIINEQDRIREQLKQFKLNNL
jgi:very-short-patch-repair endonuclease